MLEIDYGHYWLQSLEVALPRRSGSPALTAWLRHLTGEGGQPWARFPTPTIMQSRTGRHSRSTGSSTILLAEKNGLISAHLFCLTPGSTPAYCLFSRRPNA